MSKVTVLMPVCNAENYVQEAINSILHQSFQDFQLLILNDASTDRSHSIILANTDSRIIYINNEQNLGLAGTLNKGLSLVDTEYVLRMDADDLCHPQRIGWQVQFMDEHPDVDVSGTWLSLFGDVSGKETYLAGHETLRAITLFCTPVAHATVIFRHAAMAEAGHQYDIHFSCTEDYDLWSRMINTVRFDNLQRVAYKYRRHLGCATVAYRQEMLNQYYQITSRQLNRIGIHPTQSELALHAKIGLRERACDMQELHEAEAWMLKVMNSATAYGYDLQGVSEAFALLWFQFVRNSAAVGWQVSKKYLHSPLSNQEIRNKSDWFKLIISVCSQSLRKTMQSVNDMANRRWGRPH